MAYEEDTSTVTAALKQANTVVFSDDTINKILALSTKTDSYVRFDTVAPDANGNVTVPAGAEVVLIDSSPTTPTTLNPPSNAPVVIFQGRGGVIATINDGSTVPAHQPGVTDRVIVGSAGNDHIIVADARNTQIVLGSGNSSVVAGNGFDTIIAGLGNSTISGSGGDDIVQLRGNASNYKVTVNNGHAIVTDNVSDKVTDISKIQYVQLDNGKALVFASNTVEAAVTTLYETAFGRTADAGGLDYWFDVAKAGVSLSAIAEAFTSSSEFQSTSALLNDESFVASLYRNTFDRDGEDAGVAYWVDALTHGSTRADLIKSFADIASQNIDGTVQTEAIVVGSVTIVTGII